MLTHSPKNHFSMAIDEDGSPNHAQSKSCRPHHHYWFSSSLLTAPCAPPSYVCASSPCHAEAPCPPCVSSFPCSLSCLAAPSCLSCLCVALHPSHPSQQ